MNCPYELELGARVDGGPDRFRFETADGVHAKRSFRPAERALLEGLWGTEPGRLLVLQGNYGVVPTVLAAGADAVHVTEASARAARCCEHNAALNGADVTVSVVPQCTALDATVDVAAYAPKPYTPLAVGKRRLANALSLLPPGGRLFLAATERSGLARYREWLGDLAADVERHDTAVDCPLVVATAPATLDPPTVVEPRTVEPTVEGVDLSLVTVPGLFSPGSLDAGTRLLAAAVEVADGERVLDLCCGYGALGAYASRAADCEAWLTDDDAVATACAECSLRASDADGTVLTGDGVRPVVDRRFDLVLCNPPTHAGDGVLGALLGGARDVVAPGGRLVVVHHRALSLERHLAGFETVAERRRGAEHLVLAARP